MPFITRAFNTLKMYVYNHQRFFSANKILEQIYYITFLKRLFIYVGEKGKYNTYKII